MPSPQGRGSFTRVGGKGHGHSIVMSEVRPRAWMKTFAAFLRAFRKSYTYDVRRNSYLWLGAFWGLLIPLFVYIFDLRLLEPGGKGPFEEFRAHPTHLILLIQPTLLGILFGAMGSVRHDLEADNERLIENLQ